MFYILRRVWFLLLLNYKYFYKQLYKYRKSSRRNSLKAVVKLQGKHDWRIPANTNTHKSQIRTLSLNAVNDSQLPRVKAPQASEPTFESSFEGHGERRGSQLYEVEWESLSETIFCTFKGNGNKVKGDFRKKVKVNVILEMERKHVRIIQPEATEDSKNTTYGTLVELQLSYRMTVAEGDRRVKPVSWINVSNRPHSAVCSHTLHNPSKSCHCKCTLNESPSIPRLAKVRCD